MRFISSRLQATHTLTKPKSIDTCRQPSIELRAPHTPYLIVGERGHNQLLDGAQRGAGRREREEAINLHHAIHGRELTQQAEDDEAVDGRHIVSACGRDLEVAEIQWVGKRAKRGNERQETRRS